MSALVYRVPGRATTVNFLGYTDFAQCTLPIVAKSDSGLDSMTLDYIGAAPKLAAFMATLAQGKRFDANGRPWYLQTWRTDDNRLWPTVTLQCVGFASGAPPAPLQQNDYTTQSITIAANVYEDQTSSGGVEHANVRVNVTREIEYKALQTTWTYIATSKPTGPRIGKVSRNWGPVPFSSVIDVATGFLAGRYSGALAPAPYVAATTPAIVDRIMSLTDEQIPGTPFYTVQEIVCRMYAAA